MGLPRNGLILAGFAIAIASCGGRVATIDSKPVDIALVSACARYVSCDATDQTIGSCIAESGAPFTWLHVLVHGWFALTSVDCINAAPGCDSATRCLRGTVTRGCGDVSLEGACDGNTQLTCDALGELIAIDCSEQGALDLGGTCVTPVGHSSQCGFAACTQGAPVECDGNVEVDCNAGVTSRLTCPPGSSCVPGQGCTGDGPPCTSDRCDGDDDVSCTHGREWRIHCADEPIVGTCVVDPGKPGSPSSASCKPSPLLACDPLTYVQSCDGTLLRYCDGEPRAIDCAVLGFSTCDATGKVALCK